VLLPLRQPCEAAKDPVQTNPRADNRRPKEVRSWKAEVRTSPYRRRQDSDFGLQHFHHLLVNCVYSCRYRSTHSEATEVSGVPLNRRDPARQSRNRGWSADILVRSNPERIKNSRSSVSQRVNVDCCGQECPRSGLACGSAALGLRGLIGSSLLIAALRLCGFALNTNAIPATTSNRHPRPLRLPL
jgi:hypothetical protein